MNSMIGSRGPTGGVKGDRVPKGYNVGQLQQFTPSQLKLFKQMFSHVSPDSFLSKLSGGDQESFDEREAPALRQFNELQGNIASRFSGMGTGGRHSSGFQNTMNQASSNFAQDLQSKRQDYQRQALMDLMGISKELLGERPYDRALFQKPQKQQSSGGWGGAIGAGLGGIGGFLAGGPAGALSGARVGYGVGSGF